MDIYSSLVRPFLFRLSADQAHGLVRWALRFRPAWRLLGRNARSHYPRLATSIAGLQLDSPIGLAPGLDKDGRFISSLSQLGFGYLVVGSITKEPRKGNPFPRLVRYPETQAITNSMGLPSLGLEQAIKTLRHRPASGTKVIGSVAGFTMNELVECAERIEPHVDAVEIGLVCPNTTPEERIEELQIFTSLAKTLTDRIHKPLFIKVPPYFDGINRDRVMAMLDVCLRTGVDGLSLTGIGRMQEPKLGSGQGVLTGKPAFPDTLRITREVVERCRGRIAIRVSGGVFTGGDAAEVLRAGADAVEFYTAFVYRGWNTAGMIARELDTEMARAGIANAHDLQHSIFPVS
jgi:dihydroorotate dehydrogenase